MFKKMLTAAAAVATVATAVTPSAAMARHWDNDGYRGGHYRGGFVLHPLAPDSAVTGS